MDGYFKIKSEQTACCIVTGLGSVERYISISGLLEDNARIGSYALHRFLRENAYGSPIELRIFERSEQSLALIKDRLEGAFYEERASHYFKSISENEKFGCFQFDTENRQSHWTLLLSSSNVQWLAQALQKGSSVEVSGSIAWNILSEELREPKDNIFHFTPTVALLGQVKIPVSGEIVGGGEAR